MRIATGAFILNSGLQKVRGVDDETAKHLHDAASSAYPVLDSVDAKLFVRALGAAETALGAALLLPIVPARLAGAGLTGFSGALLGMYWRTPGMHGPGDPRPTPQGLAMAKDSWMLGIGASLLLDSAVSGLGEARAVRKAERRARKAEAKAEARSRKDELRAASAERRTQLKAEAKQRAKAMQAEARTVAKTQAKAARKSAGRLADSAADSAKSVAGNVGGAARSAADTTRSVAQAAADKIGA